MEESACWREKQKANKEGYNRWLSYVILKSDSRVVVDAISSMQVGTS
jgi:chorismate-pyruvate lyase